MAIVEDTRQKADKHDAKHRYWDENGTSWRRCALPYGDYWPTPSVCVDTKQDIKEIAINLCGSGKEKKRFNNECLEAKRDECKLIFLIEDKHFASIEDLYGKRIWLHNGQTVPGDQVAMAMYVHEERYGCRFMFCRPEDSARVIKELLDNAK